MRKSEKDELIDRLDVIDEALHSAKYWVQRDNDPNGIQEAMFRFGTASAYITRLREDIRNMETDPDEDAPELPAKAPGAEDAGITLAGSSGWKKYKAAIKDEAGTTGTEQKTEDTEDVVLPAPKEEQPAAGSGARVKVSRLPDAGTLPPTKEVRVPDEELPKPRRRGRPKKKFTLDEDLPDPLE